jgi:hypothetical protein
MTQVGAAPAPTTDVTAEMLAVTKIDLNNWLYGVDAQAGAVAIGPSSAWAMNFCDLNICSWAIEIGMVAD